MKTNSNASCMAFIVFGCLVLAASRGQTAANDRGPFANEARLVQPVTFSHERIRLGELVDALARDTGTKLEVDDETIEPVSGYPITISVHSRPAAEVLESIAALYSTPPDRWYWESKLRNGSKRWVLRHTLPAAQVRQARAAAIRDGLLRHIRKMAAFHGASPEQKRSLAASDPMLAAFSRARSAGFFSFLAGANDQQLETLLAGGSVEIPRSSLSAQQIAFIESEHRMANVTNSGGNVTLEGAAMNEPTVFLNLGAVGSHGVVGGIWMNAELSERATKAWLAASENRDPPNVEIPRPGTTNKPEDFAINSLTLGQIATRISKLSGVSVVMDEGSTLAAGTLTTDFPLKGKLSELLPRLTRDRLMWKRRRGFLLFRPTDWDAEVRERFAPWPLIHGFRTSCAGNKGYLQPTDWFKLAVQSREVLRDLESEFPDAGPRQIGRVLPLVRLAAQMPEPDRRLLSDERGALAGQLSGKSREALRYLFPESDLPRIRLRLQWIEGEGPPRGRFYLGPDEPFSPPIEVAFQARKEGKSHKENGD